jgi:hypothetical protein
VQRPTEEFFGESFGLSLTMNPNFEDLSCEMVFGQARATCSSSLPIESVCLFVIQRWCASMAAGFFFHKVCACILLRCKSDDHKVGLG